MMQIHDGQCGLCTHFGQGHNDQPQLIQIRKKHEAPETFIDKCGHPQHAPLNLTVTAASGCAGFQPAQA